MSDKEDYPSSEVEDYPGPSHNHPEKEGQDPEGRADEEMIKPPTSPEPQKRNPTRRKRKSP
jgi:hypothetical protein